MSKPVFLHTAIESGLSVWQLLCPERRGRCKEFVSRGASATHGKNVHLPAPAVAVTAGTAAETPTNSAATVSRSIIVWWLVVCGFLEGGLTQRARNRGPHAHRYHRAHCRLEP